MLFRSVACALWITSAAMGQAADFRGYSDLEIQKSFDVNVWKIEELNLDTKLYEDLTFEIELGGVNYVLGLLYDSIRSPHYQALIVDDTGVHTAEEIYGETPPSYTYKGDVVD